MKDACMKLASEIKKMRSLLLDIITVWRSVECYARYRAALPHATYSLVRQVMHVEIHIYAIYKSSAWLTRTFICDLRPGCPDTWL